MQHFVEFLDLNAQENLNISYDENTETETENEEMAEKDSEDT